MIKRPISRVMLTGVVGVALVFSLGGCSVDEMREQGELRRAENAARYKRMEDCGGRLEGGKVVGCVDRNDVVGRARAAAAAEVKRAVEGTAAQIQELGEQAAETAVEAYTEEPRWEGATDYSQVCSPSSGDLGC